MAAGARAGAERISSTPRRRECRCAAQTRAGFALMGGGTDLDEAFQFLCDRAGGGDFLVLRATGDDEYNPYIHEAVPSELGGHADHSQSRGGGDPLDRRRDSNMPSAIFIAGGDQANYINFWMGTPRCRRR